jgi:hypothetical protein
VKIILRDSWGWHMGASPEQLGWTDGTLPNQINYTNRHGIELHFVFSSKEFVEDMWIYIYDEVEMPVMTGKELLN